MDSLFNYMNTVKLAPLLLIFVEVAKRRSFSAAARQLGLSKSAVSQQIKRLEDATGQQLLVRNTRGVVITTVGEALLARSERLSEQMSLALTELESVKEQPSGKFKVSVPPFFENNIVIPAISQLCLEFPLIQPEIVITGRWQDLIQENLDVAIFGGNLKECNYRALSIGKTAERFCASPRYLQDHLQEHGPLVCIEDLSSHKFIATPWQNTELDLFDTTQNSQRLYNIEHSAKTNTLATVREMVLNHMGIALCPEFLVQADLRAERLIPVLPTVTGRAWHFYFIHQYMGEKPIHIRRFYQLICHHYNKVHLGSVGDENSHETW